MRIALIAAVFALASCSATRKAQKGYYGATEFVQFAQEEQPSDDQIFVCGYIDQDGDDKPDFVCIDQRLFNQLIGSKATRNTTEL